MDVSTAAAFIAAGVALVVGLLSPLIAARTTREALRHQRILATDERLWHRRAETYEAVLRWAGRARAKGTPKEDLSDPGRIRTTADESRMPVDLEAKMTAYASGAVYASAQYFQQSNKDFLYATADLLEAAATSPSPSTDQLTALERACEDAANRSDHLADRMAQLVSDDLHGLLPNDSGRTFFLPGR